jgi:hypothetical protein
LFWHPISIPFSIIAAAVSGLGCTMKTPMSATFSYSRCGCAVVLLTVLGCGCVTSALWKKTEGRSWLPDAPREARLLATTNKEPLVAILFSQSRISAQATNSRPVVLLLSQAPPRLVADSDELWSVTSRWRSGQSLPIVCETNTIPPALTNTAPGCVVITSDPTRFLLHVSGVPPGPYTLPSRWVKPRSVLRLFATPVALAADAAIVAGAICSTCADMGMVSGGCP